jgi:hypothetical protein
MQLDGLPIIEAHGDRTVFPNPLHSAEVAGTNTDFAVGIGKPDSLTHGNVALLIAVHRALPGLFLQECRIIGNLVGITGRNGKDIIMRDMGTGGTIMPFDSRLRFVQNKAVPVGHVGILPKGLGSPAEKSQQECAYANH